MYKHVAKQRKLAASNKELRLSDEESSGDSASEISNSDSDSNSDAGSSDEDGGDAIDEIDEMLAGGSGGEDEEEEEEEEMGPPPAGFPTALEALEAGRSIAEVEEEGETASKADKDVVLVCVVCPNKVLKLGKMLEIHLGSKDHVRRITRFRKHVTSPEFPQLSLEFDARSIAKQLDKIVNARLSAQTQFGGEAAEILTKITSTKRARGQDAEDEEDSQGDDEDEDEAAALQGKSKRAEKKAEREQKMKVKRVARKEKIARINREKEAKSAGIVVEGASASKIYTKPKPSPEEIAARQAGKLQKREAAAAAKLLAEASVAELKISSEKPKKEKKAQKSINKIEAPIAVETVEDSPKKVKKEKGKKSRKA